MSVMQQRVETATRPAARTTIPVVVAILVVIDLVLPVTAGMLEPHVLLPVTGDDTFRALPAFGLLFAAGAALVASRRLRSTDHLRLYALAFALRAVMAIGLAYSFHYDDEAALHDAAVSGYGSGYARLIRVFYDVFGANLLVAKAVNVTLGALLVVLAADLARHIGRGRPGLLAAVAPPLVVYSAVNLKETATALAILVCVSALVKEGRRARETRVGRGRRCCDNGRIADLPEGP